ncbi:MAG: hypothetical protein NUW37_14590 [Planctomycetes bacterium]|nr:hypothetical protein [Planctomycetota bacterium]
MASQQDQKRYQGEIVARERTIARRFFEAGSIWNADDLRSHVKDSDLQREFRHVDEKRAEINTIVESISAIRTADETIRALDTKMARLDRNIKRHKTENRKYWAQIGEVGYKMYKTLDYGEYAEVARMFFWEVDNLKQKQEELRAGIEYLREQRKTQHFLASALSIFRTLLKKIQLGFTKLREPFVFKAAGGKVVEFRFADLHTDDDELEDLLQTVSENEGVAEHGREELNAARDERARSVADLKKQGVEGAAVSERLRELTRTQEEHQKEVDDVLREIGTIAYMKGLNDDIGDRRITSLYLEIQREFETLAPMKRELGRTPDPRPGEYRGKSVDLGAKGVGAPPPEDPEEAHVHAEPHNFSPAKANPSNAAHAQPSSANPNPAGQSATDSFEKDFEDADVELDEDTKDDVDAIREFDFDDDDEHKSR